MNKLIRKPFIPSAVLIVLDVLVLLGAVVINILRDSMEYTYTLTDGKIIMGDPLGWFSVVAAVAIGAAAALTAAQIVLNAMLARSKTSSDKEFRGDLLFLNVGAVLLLLLSVGAMLFAMWFAVPERAESETFYSFNNGRYELTIAEERYSDGTLTGKVYDTTYPDEIQLVHSYELAELSENGERYDLSAVNKDVVRILYTDGAVVRTLHIDLSLYHQGHDHPLPDDSSEQDIPTDESPELHHHHEHQH